MSYLIAINHVDDSAWNQVFLKLFPCIIIFFTDTGETYMMSKFSSLELLEAFTKGNLSLDIRASRLKSSNDTYENIFDASDIFFDLVNSKAGGTVYGWGQRGFLNDVSLLVNDIKEPGDNKVLSWDISNHVLHIYGHYPLSITLEIWLFTITLLLR